jgi:uncharacterized protein (UPF0333 family)
MIENQNTNQLSSRPKKSFIKKQLPLLLIVLVIILSLTSAYFYKKSKGSPDQASQAEIKSLIEKVGRLAILPTDETPTIATVSDPNALKDQAFFVDAKKGDKVLIYSNAKKAVLYDPSQDKIVNIAPLNTDQQKTNTQTNTSDTTPKVDVKTQKKN